MFSFAAVTPNSVQRIPTSLEVTPTTAQHPTTQTNVAKSTRLARPETTTAATFTHLPHPTTVNPDHLSPVTSSPAPQSSFMYTSMRSKSSTEILRPSPSTYSSIVPSRSKTTSFPHSTLDLTSAVPTTTTTKGIVTSSPNPNTITPNINATIPNASSAIIDIEKSSVAVSSTPTVQVDVDHGAPSSAKDTLDSVSMIRTNTRKH